MEEKKGTVVSVNSSERKGTVKHPIGSGFFQRGTGLSGDAHAGPGKRQVSLLAEESIRRMSASGAVWLSPGSFAENITTRGLVLHSLPVGTLLRIGETLHVITQIGKECHKGCAIREQVGSCVMPTEGIFTNVLESGTVREGDAITVLADALPAAPVLSHLDSRGNARMVDVSQKPETLRRARAAGRVRMRPQTVEAVFAGSMPKGDVLAAARIAGIMAAKRTSELIPLCHLLPLHAVEVDFCRNDAASAVDIVATASCTGKTGVEMEALTAVSVAALTLYDMCKAIDREMLLTDIRLLEKDGGRSGHFVRGKEQM